jgi:hypothetical protein
VKSIILEEILMKIKLEQMKNSNQQVFQLVHTVKLMKISGILWSNNVIIAAINLKFQLFQNLNNFQNVFRKICDIIGNCISGKNKDFTKQILLCTFTSSKEIESSCTESVFGRYFEISIAIGLFQWGKIKFLKWLHNNSR